MRHEQFSAGWSQAYVGGNYLAEMGFVQTNRIPPDQSHHWLQVLYHVKKDCQPWSRAVRQIFFFDPDLSLTDREMELSYSLTWMDRSSISLDLEEGYVKLLEPFDPTNTGGEMIPAGSEFNWTEMSLDLRSPTSDNSLPLRLQGRYGGFFSGTRASVKADMNYRVQPYGSLSLMTSYNRILLPEPYTSADLILMGPRLDITFTETLFFTTFVQYNNQIDNLNVNMRFQWRFAPVSDLFIVYTENSYPNGLLTKDRGIVLKISYWLN